MKRWERDAALIDHSWTWVGATQDPLPSSRYIENKRAAVSFVEPAVCERQRNRRKGLQVAKYEPREHYNVVKEKWYGLRTPDR